MAEQKSDANRDLLIIIGIASLLAFYKFSQTNEYQELLEQLIIVLWYAIIITFVGAITGFLIYKHHQKRKLHQQEREQEQQKLKELKALRKTYGSKDELAKAQQEYERLEGSIKKYRRQLKKIKQHLTQEQTRLLNEAQAYKEELWRNIQEARKRKAPDTRVGVYITLDPNKGLFPAKNLTIEERNYLEMHKYTAAYFVPIGKTKQEEFYIKETPPESISHTFLVLNIKEHLKKYTKEITIAKTKEPDITFKNGKGDLIVLEIETGKGFNKHIDRIKEKFQTLEQQHKKNLHIILTDSNQKRKYQHLFPKINIMTRKDIPTFLAASFPNLLSYIIGQRQGVKKRPKRPKSGSPGGNTGSAPTIMSRVQRLSTS